MLHDALSFLFVMIFGGLATLIIGGAIYIAVAVGGELGFATFLYLWQRNWFKAATIAAGVLLVVIIAQPS